MVRQMFAPAFAPVGQHSSLLVQHLVASTHAAVTDQPVKGSMVRQRLAPAVAFLGHHSFLLVQHIVASMHVLLWSDCKGNIVKNLCSRGPVYRHFQLHIAGRHMCGV